MPHAQDEVDLLLEEAIEEEADEALDVDLATEILTAPPPYATEEDDHRDFNVQLSPVPTSLARELKAYEEYRQSPFQRERASAQVVDTTVASDRANALRWLHYVKEHHAQAVPSLKLFASSRVGAWTQAWLAWLKEKGLMSSTLAVVRGTLPCCIHASLRAVLQLARAVCSTPTASSR